MAGLSLNVGMASRASAGMSGRLAGRVRTAAVSSHKGSFCGRSPCSGPTNPLHDPVVEGWFKRYCVSYAASIGILDRAFSAQVYATIDALSRCKTVLC